jgi:hypothetical protein
VNQQKRPTIKKLHEGMDEEQARSIVCGAPLAHDCQITKCRDAAKVDMNIEAPPPGRDVGGIPFYDAASLTATILQENMQKNRHPFVVFGAFDSKALQVLLEGFSFCGCMCTLIVSLEPASVS